MLQPLRSNTTLHGFRASFSDWRSEETGFDRETAEAALQHHVVGDEVERSYRRGDQLSKRRELMQAWSDYLKATADRERVVPYRKRG